uniref:Uncharacterized protein n=1 Tax=Apteryx owenii TaxID=8824 RepID=A0A8B9NUF8_APTOW
MSLCSRFLEDATRELRKADREIKRQLKVLDLQLPRLCDDLLPPCVCSGRPRCPCDPLCRASCLIDPTVSYLLLLSSRVTIHPSVSWTERLSSCFYFRTQRRLNKMLNSSHDHKLLALMDVKGFDPDEVTVKVKDGKVKVLAGSSKQPQPGSTWAQCGSVHCSSHGACAVATGDPRLPCLCPCPGCRKAPARGTACPCSPKATPAHCVTLMPFGPDWSSQQHFCLSSSECSRGQLAPQASSQNHWCCGTCSVKRYNKWLRIILALSSW